MPLVQVIPLGGAGEIGKNCTAVVQDEDIIVIDCGLSFPHEEHFGVDIVIPDFSWLVENRDRIRGIFLTHAHEDHVGALAFAVPQLKCPVYATEFTAGLVRSKLEERMKGGDIDLRIIAPGKTYEAGSLSVEPIRVTHSIPETCAMAVRTHHGIVFFTADFKFDFTPVDGRLTDVERLAEIGKEGVVLLVSDSTNIDRPGWGPSESSVTAGLRQVFAKAQGRILITSFASNIHRMQQAMDVAYEMGRKVSVAGRRMDVTIDLCARMGYLRIPEGVYVRLEDIGKYQANELVILTTGSQGEPMAALSQMSRGEYSRMKIVEGDTILYSARPIPGNEGGIWRTINRLIKMGADVVHDSPTPIHVSGHAYQEEIKMMISLVNPFYIAPVHGEPRHQKLYREMALGMGFPDHRVFTLENGSCLCLDDDRALLGEPVQAGDMLIDQHGDVPVTDAVLGQRSALGHDGVVVVSLPWHADKGVVGKPEAQIRGFSGPPSVIEDALDALCDALDGMKPEESRDRACVEGLVSEVVRKMINRKCQQRPVVIPAVVEVE